MRDIAVTHAPIRPRALGVVLLEEREVAPVAELTRGVVVVDLMAVFVDADDRDGGGKVERVELGLEGVEVTKLATAVASRSVCEVPGAHLLEVVARRHVLP